MKTTTQHFELKHGLYTFLLGCVLILSTMHVRAQTWSDVGGGVNDFVNATIVYNNELIVGGRFTNAGGVPANHIARWNGTSWSSLGTGLNGWVDALAVYNGDLIVGGGFTEAGGNPVNFLARWDGNSWYDVNGDMGSYVAALAVYNGDLIVGGYFTDADGFPANYIVGFDGNNWFNLGTGMGGSQGQVMALYSFNSMLYAGGFFSTAGGLLVNQIAQWDGNAWSAMSGGIGGIVYSLGSYNNQLIAGGLYNSAGSVTASSIASWDGTIWSPLGSGIGATPVGYKYVFALANYNGELYAGGMFDTAGGILSYSIAKWNGTTWYGLNGGVQYGGANAYAVNALTVFGSDLYAGGIFSTAGGVGAAHVAKWHENPTGVSSTEMQTSTPGLLIYPNPASSHTYLEYVVCGNEQILIDLYDTRGRLIRSLYRGTQKDGKQQFLLNGSAMPSPGMYEIRIVAGNRMDSKILVVQPE